MPRANLFWTRKSLSKISLIISSLLSKLLHKKSISQRKSKYGVKNRNGLEKSYVRHPIFHHICIRIRIILGTIRVNFLVSAKCILGSSGDVSGLGHTCDFGSFWKRPCLFFSIRLISLKNLLCPLSQSLQKFE